MYRLASTVGLVALLLSGCGGGSSSDSSSNGVEPDAVDNTQTPTEPTPTTPSDGVIPPSDDDIGTIPEIGDPPDGEPSETPDSPTPSEPTTTPDDTPSEPIGLPSTGSSDRVTRWRAALNQTPSADATGRSSLIAALSEMSQHNFVFEFADAVYAVEQRLVSGDSVFEPINVSIGLFTRTHLCSDGGRVLSNDTSENGLRQSTYLFEACVVGSQQFDGSYSISERLSINRMEVYLTVSVGLTWIHDNVEQAFSGVVIQTASIEADNGSFSSAISGFYSEKSTNEETPFLITYNTHGHGYANPDFTSSDDTGYAVLNRMRVEPGNDLPEWSANDFSATGLRGEVPNSLTFGQLPLDTDAQDRAVLVIRIDNGDPDSFDLIGFTDDDTVGSAVYAWDDALTFKAPLLYSFERALNVPME